MMATLGSGESPRLRIALSGMLSQQPLEFDAIVDTGFTGAVSMPMVRALPLGLVLFAVAPFTLADGSRETALLCMGHATIAGVRKSIVIALSRGSDVLIGTELFDTFGMAMHLDYTAKTFDVRVQNGPPTPPR